VDSPEAKRYKKLDSLYWCSGKFNSSIRPREAFWRYVISSTCLSVNHLKEDLSYLT
jgi:hypothetical protein